MSVVPWKMLLSMRGWDYYDQVLYFDFTQWLKDLWGEEEALDF